MPVVSIAPPKPSQLAPGYRLDRYELLCPIAEGGMASVWVARLKGKHGFEKLVAIKTILPKYASDDRFQQMFLDEARIAAGIEHTNVAQILDLGEEHDVLYLVMEWVDGDSLSKLIRTLEKKKIELPPGVACRILADVCGGLHVAHELRGNDGKHLGVVHRDVSPQNILVSTKGVAKLIDFGIAKAKDRLAGETSAGLLKGKVQYMAPEQALGQPIDGRADLWSIGSILYHVFAGKPAYDGENQLAQLHLLTSGTPPAPLPASVPRPVADVITRTLSFRPDDRYASAADLQRALEKAMLDAGITTSPADVAAFVRGQMSDRAEARKSAVELALKAAAERAHMAEMLRAPVSGMHSEETPSPVRTTPARGTPNPMEQDRGELVSVPSQSSSTLGDAGVMTPHDGAEAIPRDGGKRRRAMTYAVGITLGAAAIVGLAALSVTRKGNADATPAAGAGGAAMVNPAAATSKGPDIPSPTPQPPATADPVAPNTAGSTAALVAGKPPPGPSSARPPAATPRPVAPPPPKPPTKPVVKPGVKPPVDDGF